MSNRIIRQFKKLVATLLVVGILVLNNSSLLYAQTAPSAPSVPTVPDAPEVPSEPEPEVEEPEAPTAPTVEEYLNPTPTPTSVPEPTPTEDPEDTSSSDESSSEGSTETDNTASQDSTSTDAEDTNVESTGNQNESDGSDPYIETGDATSSTVITNDANSNLSAEASSDDGQSVTVVNNENGEGSENDGSIKIVDSDQTFQDNSAVVTNDLNQSSVSGENKANDNSGDATIKTGDTNTSGTIINSVNTNVDGIAVVEFNVVDDHIGDIILDPSSNCIFGCGGDGGVLVKNTGNLEGSENNAGVEIVDEDLTFQNNDAEIINNMNLLANSGDNKTNDNVGGDTTIETGDANVSANVVNMVNNNFAGNVIYAVVNIFGDLIGNIIAPEGAFGDCEDNTITAVNSDNGAESDNDVSVSDLDSDQIYQFNTVELENNIVFDANTGGNVLADNGGGSNEIKTGDTDIKGQIVNIANTNIVNGDWWLVIVNEAGQWIGKIMGAPEGANVGGSDGFIFTADENGEITVANTGNGEGSTNNASVDSTSENIIVQENNAKIVNNINLSANTGGNQARDNIGGDHVIETGDVNIIANITNFVNNNIVGSGRLFVTVVNVFGSWVGDFITPGYAKEESQDHIAENSAGVGGVSSSDEPSGESSDSGGGGNDQENVVAGDSETKVKVVAVTKITQSESQANSGAEEVAQEETEDEGQVMGVSDSVRRININLAWGFLLIPVLLLLIGIKKRSLLLSLLPGRSG